MTVSSHRVGLLTSRLTGSFRKRLTRKLDKSIEVFRNSLKKFISRLYLCWPLASQRNLRKKLIGFADTCVVLNSHSVSTETAAVDWYVKIRNSEVIRRNPSVTLRPDDVFKLQRGTLSYEYSVQFEVPETFLACIHNARLFGENHLVLSGKGDILLESALSSSDILEASGIFETLFHPKIRHLPGKYCLLMSPWSQNAYYHWLLEALPRLETIEKFRDLDSVPLIVHRDLKPYQWDTLKMTGVSSRLVSLETSHTQVDKLFFPSVCSTFGSPSPSAVNWLRNKFLGGVPAFGGKRRLYITRRDTKRRVINEAEILGYLEKFGFEVVCPGDLPFLQQVALFSEAEIVIGPHGGGFTNMVFAPAGATLVEFFGDNYVNPCFWALANVCQQRHAVIISPTTTLDYFVPLNDLVTLCRQLKL